MPQASSAQIHWLDDFTTLEASTLASSTLSQENKMASKISLETRMVKDVDPKDHSG